MVLCLLEKGDMLRMSPQDAESTLGSGGSLPWSQPHRYPGPVSWPDLCVTQVPSCAPVASVWGKLRWQIL